MRIGLYFGSFNPIHIGHLVIANYILNSEIIDKLWLIVTPQNPLKNNKSLLHEYDRLHFARLCTEDDNRIKVSDIEFHLPKPSYTIYTLIYLKEKYPEHSFFIIMGSDSFQNLHNWKNAEAIVKNYDIIVYPRHGFEVKNNLGARLHTAEAPLIEISSTKIRELIKKGKSIRYLVPEKVREEIEMNRLYKK